MRDHGGDLDAAIARHGGAPADWIDLSTGINRVPYPAPVPTLSSWQALPTAREMTDCAEVARRAYGAPPGAACLPVGGAQAAIRLLPRLGPPGRCGILAPTYNEYAAAFSAAGWTVTEVADVEALRGFDAAVVVNPNNPDGRRWTPAALLEVATAVGLFIIDESFVDPDPEVSLCRTLGREGLIVLRSLGKFYGLAGARLGFALGAKGDIEALSAAAGPWAVSGPALAVGRAALGDSAWARAARARLIRDAGRLDAIVVGAGLQCVGGTALFRLYAVEDAATTQHRLARARIWSRIFPYSRNWIRLGLPGAEHEWRRLEAALGVPVSAGEADRYP